MRITRILYFLRIGQKKSLDLEKQSISSIERRQLFLQFALALIANIGNISPGMSLGFSAVALPQLQNKNATFQIDESQASWTASLASISILFGSLIFGDMLDRFGRKATLLFLNVPSLLGWLLIAFAGGKSTLGMIYAGRFLTGLSVGFVHAATVYCAEIASDSLRGVFISWTTTAASLGILLVYVLGYIIQDNWRLLAGISTIFPVCALILTFFFLPETPSWLCSKGRTKEVEKSLKKIRGIPKSKEMTPSVQKELKILTDKYNKTPGDDIPQKNLRQLIFRAETIKPFIIMNLFFFFQQVSGIYVVIFYTVDIAKEAGVTWDRYLVTILIGVARVVLNVAVSFITKRFGRRKPSIASGTGMAVSMGALAVFVYLQSTDTISQHAAQSLTWIPTICLIMHIASSTIGFLTVPWAMIGEVYPSEVRGVAAGLTGAIANGFGFIILKLYPDMLHAFGKFGVFTFYGVISAVGTAFVVFFLPETEGKSLQDIEESFSKKKKNEQTHF